MNTHAANALPQLAACPLPKDVCFFLSSLISQEASKKLASFSAPDLNFGACACSADALAGGGCAFVRFTYGADEAALRCFEQLLNGSWGAL